MTTKARNILILIILIVLIGGYFIFFNKPTTPQDPNAIPDISKNPGLKVCPDEMVVNEMSGPDRSGETVDNTDTPVRSSYYMLKGERREVDEFNTAWVAANCYVPGSSN